MEFSESYFAGEIREDFYVRPMIKRAWAVQMDILCQIDTICKRHNISYYAEYGTLLGAVRHKGYIPWDDDLDIGMLRDDYERFLLYAPDELTGGLEIITPYNELNYKELMARVITGRRINPDPYYLQSHHGCPYVLGVDIFPQDFIPRDKQKENMQLELLYAVNALAQSWEMEGMSEEDKWECLNQIAEICGVCIDDKIPVDQQLYQLSDRICAMYHREEADEVTHMERMTTDRNWRLPLHCFESTIEIPFENITIPVPIGYDQALKLRYGENYMTPVKSWGTHSYPIFKEQEEILKQAYQNMNKEIPQCFAE